MSNRLVHGSALFTAVSILCVIVFFGGVATAQDHTYDLVPCALDNNEQCIEIVLPCTEPEVYGKAGWYEHGCNDEVIQIPNGRPIYAFLVSGFDQNHKLNMFHFYNFARCIFREANDLGKKAYVHFAWWNNLLAPYMEKPLHNGLSVPSRGGALDAIPDYVGFPYLDPIGNRFPTKAIPAEDYQFQKDAKAVLEAIRDENPDAVIILVGHSMGGDSVIRLAESTDRAIDLLAPIDPVGNRTCLPNIPSMTTVQMEWRNTTCNGAYNFTRFQATHTDWFYYPYRISFEDNNIGYLYHRWQNEAPFPFDYGCPNIESLCPLQAHMQYWPVYDWYEAALPYRYLFRHNPNSTNVQTAMTMNDESGLDVYPIGEYKNWGGAQDGHGEIVGFRALEPNVIPPHSFPLALEAQGNWPSLDVPDLNWWIRVIYMKNWEADWDYLDSSNFAPKKPPRAYCEARNYAYNSDYCTYCMVSGDLCAILAEIIGQAPATMPWIPLLLLDD